MTNRKLPTEVVTDYYLIANAVQKSSILFVSSFDSYLLCKITIKGKILTPFGNDIFNFNICDSSLILCVDVQTYVFIFFEATHLKFHLVKIYPSMISFIVFCYAVLARCLLMKLKTFALRIHSIY